MAWSLVKIFHLIGATVLFGTGLGIAFFMFRSHFTGDVRQKYFAIQNTVLADFLFTLPAVVLQPLSGAWLVWRAGYDWTDRWLIWTFALYAVAGLCWLPVVAIQIRLKQLLARSLNNETPLPPQYHRLFRIWFLLGWPAFASLVVIFFLMVHRPP